MSRLPDGTRLLHIGPHKTGTTALQASLHQSREALESQGVHYAGKSAHSLAAAMTAASGHSLPTHASPATDAWTALLADVEDSQARTVVLSSEFYADAFPDRVSDIVQSLGGDRVHVVVTLRPLTRILPSQWQQYVQNRAVLSYEDWLEAMLLHADQTDVTPTFWRRHRHDLLVERWTDVVGRDRLSVVVVDEHDKSMLTSTFEGLLGLRPGTLRPAGTANRSLTCAEVELLRKFNAFWRARNWSEADYTLLVRFGAVRHLLRRTPAPTEPRLRTPAWAVDKAIEIQREMVAHIEASGVPVLGDLAALTSEPPSSGVGENDPVIDVPAVVAARLTAGLVGSINAVPRQPAQGNRVVGPLEAAARSRPRVRRQQLPTDQ